MAYSFDELSFYTIWLDSHVQKNGVWKSTQRPIALIPLRPEFPDDLYTAHALYAHFKSSLDLGPGLGVLGTDITDEVPEPFRFIDDPETQNDWV